MGLNDDMDAAQRAHEEIRKAVGPLDDIRKAMEPLESVRKAMQPLEDMRKAMAPYDSIQRALGPHLEEMERMNKLVAPFVHAEAPAISPEVFDGELASGFHRRLMEWVQEFEDSLDDEHEVGLQLANFGNQIVVHVTDISYWNPRLIKFIGFVAKKEDTDDGPQVIQQPVELIQNVGQLNFLLMKVPRTDPTKPKHRIGFHVEDEGDGLDEDSES